MKREDLEHLIRAAAGVLGEQDVLVIGSQAILGSYNDSGLPADVTLSIEADLGSFEDPDQRKADQIHGAPGELHCRRSTSPSAYTTMGPWPRPQFCR